MRIERHDLDTGGAHDRIRDALGTDAATLFDLARRLRDGLGGSIPGN